MSLSLQQAQTLKAYIEADPVLSQYPNNSDGYQEVAKALNALASPNYYVWSSHVSREAIYNSVGDGNSTWDWALYKAQSVTEQGAWREIFMNDAANFGQLNVRVGVGKIFSGTAPQNAQRDHILSIGRRLATLVEKLLAIAVTSPPANSGNNAAHARGATTNPDVLGFEEQIHYTDIEFIKSS